MNETSILDVISPIMCGPSSSHTAGAVRLGLLTRSIYGGCINSVKFSLYNSFAKTGLGHGTDKALLSGILGLQVDDSRLKNIFNSELSKSIRYEFNYLEDLSMHPNAVVFDIDGENGKVLISGASLGAGEIEINKIDDFSVRINGKYNTIMLVYDDVPHMISSVTKKIDCNIASLSCERASKGGTASMCICIDGDIDIETINYFEKMPHMKYVSYIKTI